HPVGRKLDSNRAAKMLARKLSNHHLVVVQIADVNVVSRRDRQQVAVEHKSRALLHETGQRGASAPDEIAQLGKFARAVVLKLMAKRRIGLDFALDAQPPRTARLFLRYGLRLGRAPAARAAAGLRGWSPRGRRRRGLARADRTQQLV